MNLNKIMSNFVLDEISRYVSKLNGFSGEVHTASTMHVQINLEKLTEIKITVESRKFIQKTEEKLRSTENRVL